MEKFKNCEKIKKKIKINEKIQKKTKKIDTKHENLKIKKHWAQQYIFSKKSIKKWKFY